MIFSGAQCGTFVMFSLPPVQRGSGGTGCSPMPDPPRREHSLGRLSRGCGSRRHGGVDRRHQLPLPFRRAWRMRPLKAAAKERRSHWTDTWPLKAA